MNQLLDLMSYEKSRAARSVKNQEDETSAAESNNHVISHLQDLLALAPLENDNLNVFVDLLVKKFDWRTAEQDEVDKVKNTVLDLVSIDGSCINWLVKRLISHFRSTDKEHSKVDICSRTFGSILLLKKHIREILTTSPDDVDLKGADYEIMYELLGYHSSGRLKKNTVAIFPSTHKNPRFNGLRCFFYRRKDGYVDFFSYARCCDNVKTRGQILREHICDMLMEIYRLTPSVLGTITETLDTSYPHHNVPIEHHISFTKAILYISRLIPRSRSVLYKVLINKLTVIDSEIKLADPNSVDVEKVENLRSEKLKEMADQLINGEREIRESTTNLENPDWFKKIYEKLRTEEDIDDMSQKLDFLMGIMFEELEYVLKENFERPHEGATMEPTSFSSDSEDEDSVVTPMPRGDSTPTTAETGYCIPNTRNTYSGSTAQCSSTSSVEETESRNRFVKLEGMVKHEEGGIKREADDMSSMVSSASGRGVKHTVSDMIVIDLFDAFDEVIMHTYNCKYVQFIFFFVLSFNHLWVRMFLHRLFAIVFNNSQHVIKRRTAASYISSLICRANYIAPQFVCGVLNNLFRVLPMFDYVALNSNSLKTSSSVTDYRRKNIHYFSVVSSKLSLFYSVLQDILYIICYHTSLVSASPTCTGFIEDSDKGLIAYLDSYLKPLTYCKDSIISEAIKSTSHFPNLKKLHAYLVSAQVAGVEAAEDSDNFKWLFYSPIDSFFPFDPYLLHHSRYYVRDKYRSKTTSQMMEDTKTEKAEMLRKVKREHPYDEAVQQARVGLLDSSDAGSAKDDKIINVVVDAITSDRQLGGEQLKDVERRLHDSLGFSSISRSIKAELDRRTMSTEADLIEDDYDFWGYDASLQELENDPDQEQSPKLVGKKHVILGIDQLGDLELSLCDSLLVNTGEERRPGLLDLLTSSKAYKAAAGNAKRARSTSM